MGRRKKLGAGAGLLAVRQKQNGVGHLLLHLADMAWQVGIWTSGERRQVREKAHETSGRGDSGPVHPGGRMQMNP